MAQKNDLWQQKEDLLCYNCRVKRSGAILPFFTSINLSQKRRMNDGDQKDLCGRRRLDL